MFGLGNGYYSRNRNGLRAWATERSAGRLSSDIHVCLMGGEGHRFLRRGQRQLVSGWTTNRQDNRDLIIDVPRMRSSISLRTRGGPGAGG